MYLRLILKCLFGVFTFFQKQNENKSNGGIVAVKSNFFVCSLVFWFNCWLEKIITTLFDLYNMGESIVNIFHCDFFNYDCKYYLSLDLINTVTCYRN